VGGIEVALADRRSGRLQQVPGTRTLGSPTALETVIPLDVAVDAEQLVAASALIAAELLAEFGVPDPEILKRDGTIDVPRAMKASQSLASWADQYGVSDIHRPTDSGAG
jgi:hypothetical protein